MKTGHAISAFEIVDMQEENRMLRFQLSSRNIDLGIVFFFGIAVGQLIAYFA